VAGLGGFLQRKRLFGGVGFGGDGLGGLFSLDLFDGGFGDGPDFVQAESDGFGSGFAL
jgi:hypothetical protein